MSDAPESESESEPTAGLDASPDAPDAAPEADSASRAGGLSLAFGFLTRLPFANRDLPPGALARAMGMFPLVGVVVGGVGAAAFALADLILPRPAAAIVALGATALVTGALHEDGLADTADGFGGGVKREDKLAIMRDSRIGTYGVVALALVLGLRAVALAGIGGALAVAGALIAAHALARAAIPLAMQALTPARSDGLGASAGQPSVTQTGIAVTIAIVVAAVMLPPAAALAALAGATLGTVVVVSLAQAQIGGHTGDVLGAVEQLAETFALLGVLAAQGSMAA